MKTVNFKDRWGCTWSNNKLLNCLHWN